MAAFVNDWRKIAVCADDYGLSPGVGAAIRQLIAHRKITATSCMTTSPLWPAEAEKLQGMAIDCDAGLHLTLTDQAPAGRMTRLAPEGRLPPLAKLMAEAALRRLDRAEIEDEIERQLDLFERSLGRPPDFVDGHQHVHQLPVVRDALLAVYARRLRARRPWLRYCVAPLPHLLSGPAAPRALLICLLGRTLARMGRRAGIPGNSRFRGVRNFTPGERFPALMENFLNDPVDGLLVMCHPALPDDRLATLDPVVATRPQEHAYLMSDAYDELLRRNRIRLVRPGAPADGTVTPSGAG